MDIPKVIKNENYKFSKEELLNKSYKDIRMIGVRFGLKNIKGKKNEIIERILIYYSSMTSFSDLPFIDYNGNINDALSNDSLTDEQKLIKIQEEIDKLEKEIKELDSNINKSDSDNNDCNQSIES